MRRRTAGHVAQNDAWTLPTYFSNTRSCAGAGACSGGEVALAPGARCRARVGAQQPLRGAPSATAEHRRRACRRPPGPPSPHRFTFTIHGLWPNYRGGGWPEFCDHKAVFAPAAVADLEDDMADQWPSFSYNDTSFWEHEWLKHGTCSRPVVQVRGTLPPQAWVAAVFTRRAAGLRKRQGEGRPPLCLAWRRRPQNVHQKLCLAPGHRRCLP